MRREFEMTEEQNKEIKEACRPIPYMVVGNVMPRSPPEYAIDGWIAIGRDMGFDPYTVRHVEGKSDRFFTADETPKAEAAPSGEEIAAGQPGLEKAPETPTPEEGFPPAAPEDLFTERFRFNALDDPDARGVARGYCKRHDLLFPPAEGVGHEAKLQRLSKSGPPVKVEL